MIEHNEEEYQEETLQVSNEEIKYFEETRREMEKKLIENRKHLENAIELKKGVELLMKSTEEEVFELDEQKEDMGAYTIVWDFKATSQAHKTQQQQAMQEHIKRHWRYL